MMQVVCRRPQQRCPCLSCWEDQEREWAMLCLVDSLFIFPPFFPLKLAICNRFLVRWDSYWVHLGWSTLMSKHPAVSPHRSPELRCTTVHCPDQSQFGGRESRSEWLQVWFSLDIIHFINIYILYVYLKGSIKILIIFQFNGQVPHVAWLCVGGAQLQMG